MRSWADGLYQFLGSNHLVGVIQRRNFYVTDLLNFVVPTELQIVAPDAAVAITRRFTGNGSEWNGYLGLPLLLVCACTVWRLRRVAVVPFFALLGAAMARLSLWPHCTSPATTSGCRCHTSWWTTAAVRKPAAESPGAVCRPLRRGLTAVFVDRVMVEEGWKERGVAAVALAMAWSRSGMRFKVPEGYFITAGVGSHPRVSRSPIVCWRSSMAPLTAASRQTRRLPSAATWPTTGSGRWSARSMPHFQQAGALFTEILGRPPEVTGGVLVVVIGVTPSRPGPGGCHRMRRLFLG